jgi:hypothetical protein
MKKMKNLFKISALTVVMSIMFSCTKDGSTDTDNGGGGTIPASGWRIGSSNYTTFFTMKNAGQPNSFVAFDAFPGGDNINTAGFLFNNISGVTAGTYKIVTKPNQSDLLVNEIMLTASTGYSQATGKYLKEYAAVIGQSVNAIVTISGGKVKIVVPEINIVTIPIGASSTTSTFAGTLIEK